jgi:hypothetical protein
LFCRSKYSFGVGNLSLVALEGNKWRRGLTGDLAGDRVTSCAPQKIFRSALKHPVFLAILATHYRREGAARHDENGAELLENPG